MVPVSHLAIDDDATADFGDFEVIKSQGKSGREFSKVGDLDAKVGETVWLRGRVANVRAKGNSCFVVLRQDTFDTVQACMFKDKENPEESKRMLKWLGGLTDESIIDLQGEVVTAEQEVLSCSASKVEISITKCYVVTRAGVLPFLIEDAARPEAEVEASQETDRPFPRLGQELRLDNRWVDLRVPANNAIMRIQSGVCQLFRESLYSEGFVEIHSPKVRAPGVLQFFSKV